jgi:tetratricopeptide (TPR) repeat protein
MTATDIAIKHNVDALVEPTLTCYGDMVCIQVRVITPYPEEKLLWVEDYMEDKSQMLNLYNRITKQIANELRVNLTQQEEALLDESRMVDPDAYDAYLMGRYYLDKISRESLPDAIESFNKAIEIEPEWAAPYAGLAEVGSYMKQMGFGSASDIIIMIYENLNKALALDPNSVESHYTTAVTAAWTEFDWERAEAEFMKAIELNPSHVRSHSFYAHVLTIHRRTDEALHHGKISQELDPENPFTLGLYAVVLINAGKCQEALYYIEKALSIEPGHYFAYGQLLPAYECLGDYEKWIESWGEKVRGKWNDEGREAVLSVFQDRGYIGAIEEMFEMNEKFGNEGCFMSEGIKTERYLMLRNYDKVMDHLETRYENNNHDPSLPYISTRSTYDKMKGNPRYLALLEKMDLPVPEE